jgi:hypothetical protein
MAQIALKGQAGVAKYAYVDSKDFAVVIKHSWYYRDGYAITKHNGKDLRMHRLVANETDPEVIVDHIDRDRLNNRRGNLRKYTAVENARNRCDNRRILVFGEEKTIAEWVEDEACEVNYDTLYGRLRKGVDPLWAILAPQENS